MVVIKGKLGSAGKVIPYTDMVNSPFVILGIREQKRSAQQYESASV
jgi:hypothetical protein